MIWRVALALAIVITGRRTASAAPSFHAVPDVAVIAAPVNGGGSGTLALQNDSDAPVTVSSIVADNTCDPTAVTETPTGGFTVAAHASQLVGITCKPAGPGIKRCLFHARDAGSMPLLDFEAACASAGAATLGASPQPIAFATPVTVGGTASQTLVLANHGTSAETIGRLYLELTDLGGNFALGAPCNPDGRTCEAGIPNVPVGNTANVEIACTPHTPGMHTTQLHVVTDSGQRLAAPVDVSCTGVTDPSNPMFLASPSLIEVGGVEVIGGTTAAAVTIQNVGGGTGTLDLTDVRVVDGGNGAALDWMIVASGKCHGVIPPSCKLSPGDHLDLAIGFDPSTLGARDATLLVGYVDTASRSLSIPLRGTGLGATLALVGPAAIDFGTLPVGIAQQVSFDLVNTGNRTVADVTLDGDGTPFTLSPKIVSLAHGVPATITATCQPTAASDTPFTTTFHAHAPDVLSGSPISITATCRGSTSPLYASPSTILLGEIRLGTTPVPRAIQLLGPGVTVSTAHLSVANENLVLTSQLPAPTPAALQLAIEPMTAGALDTKATSIIVSSTDGDSLAIPVSGSIVSATYVVPPSAALGTYCVGQPTTPSTVSLVSTGTATLALQAPAMQAGNASPFEVALISPTIYPDLLAPQHAATIAITPDRQPSAGTQNDDLVWTTDVMDQTTATTKITAEFVDSGGAIAPASLRFGPVPLHTMTPGQRVTVQNCNNTASLRLDTPHVTLPFSLDKPGDFPRTLMPNETMTFSVSFAPLVKGTYADTMTITSSTLATPLSVVLTGEGITGSTPADAGDGGDPIDKTSFYACSCRTGGSHGWPIALAVVLVLRRRRR